ncbi:protein of unknown function [Aquiflexum balticum DSM 16537]|uniref:DUF4249 domain-containing protein n=1 Tax=Aquiflexum balticum DSM 16537 TaxID=758820 RepID=A0A1W2GZV0_9BACT|nr:DUF4249 family protein [Aquiflexum balticum]SMD42210.1 protein of unknown function [Aquiflexum balticum DSM 16537]
MEYSSKGIRNLAALGLLYATCSCLSESPSPIEIIDSQKKLVVNGHISPDVPLLISVTNNIPFTTTMLALQNIPDARVDLWEGDRKLEEGTFQPSETFTVGFPDIEKKYPNYYAFRAFYAFESVPEAGKSYSLKVNAPGYPAVETTDRIPENAAEVPTFRILSINRANGLITLEVDLELLDEKNYFHLLFFVRTKGFDDVQQVKVVLDNEGLLNVDNNGVAFEGGLNSGIMFNPNVFGSKSNKRIIVLEYDGIIFLPDTQYELSAEMRTISKSYYDYYVAAIQQRFYGDYPFVTSILIPNNVQGGLGNFSAFTSRKSVWVDLR